jgi:hypothetical protein
VPAGSAGITAVTVVELITVTFVAWTPTIRTIVAPVRLVPVSVTVCPPVVGPDEGETPVRSGAGK